MNDDQGKGGGGHHNHGGGGGGGSHNFFSVGPGGVSYGYFSRNFSLGVGPAFGGYGNGYGGYGGYGYGPGPVYAQPYIDDSYYGPSYSVVPTYPPAYDPNYGANYGGAVNPPLSQPTPAVRPTSAAPRAPLVSTNERAAIFEQEAEAAFRAHRYEDAERAATHAIVEDMDNGRLLLLASQAKFAVGNFPAALSLVDKATTLLPEEDWGFVVKNFRQIYNNGDYVSQMDRLTKQIKDQPNDYVARILRGYHYFGLGHSDAAARDLQAALKIQPEDALAKKLLAAVSEPIPPPATSKPADRTEKSVLQRN